MLSVISRSLYHYSFGADSNEDARDSEVFIHPSAVLGKVSYFAPKLVSYLTSSLIMLRSRIG